MKTKKLDWFFESPENFAVLKGMCLLFAKDTDYYKFSGIVTAALLDYEDPDKQISILAIRTLDNWITFKYSREDLKKMLTSCVEFVGQSYEESFQLEK